MKVALHFGADLLATLDLTGVVEEEKPQDGVRAVSNGSVQETTTYKR